MQVLELQKQNLYCIAGDYTEKSFILNDFVLLGPVLGMLAWL